MAVQKYDVLVVAGGIAGLMTTRKLAQLGMRVMLIEVGEPLCGGPSTRNEGWLHRGSYHSGSISDRQTAVQVAQRCIYGHDQIRTFAPEAVEDVNARPYALVKSDCLAEELVSRYEEAGVTFRPVSSKQVCARFPDADLAGVKAAFEVNDVSINTRMLYHKLY